MTCSAADRSTVRPIAHPSLLAVLLFTALVATGCASTSAPSGGGAPLAAMDATRLLNPALSPGFSQWLLGPIAVLATAEEEREYLALRDDAAAEAFIADFWQRRNPYPERPDNALRKEFEQRAAVADRLYTEGGRSGRQTARGTIYVLFGQPSRTDYEVPPNPRDPSPEVWFYEGEQPPGLHGEKPGPLYRFIKRDRLTEFYTRLTGIERARPVRPEDY